MLLSIEPSIRY
uniref:Uncharacterized protein n=1 Tax=Arundo donax TaxID=35708 RepID=A0A0A9B1S1_ARUDO